MLPSCSTSHAISIFFIAQKKCPDALNETQKTSGLCKVRFWKKSGKTLINWPFLQFWPKKVIF